MFSITDGKGFKIKFPNGYTLSVQFGYANYSSNYDFEYNGKYGFDAQSEFLRRNREWNSDTAETAIFNEDGEFVEFDGDDVQGYKNPDDVLALMNYVASLPRKEILMITDERENKDDN